MRCRVSTSFHYPAENTQTPVVTQCMIQPPWDSSSPPSSSQSSSSSSSTMRLITFLPNRSRTNRRTGSRKAWLSRTRMALRNSATESNCSGVLVLMLDWCQLVLPEEGLKVYLYRSPAAFLVSTVFPRSTVSLRMRLCPSSSIGAIFGTLLRRRLGFD